MNGQSPDWLTVTVRADLRPGALVGLSWSLRGLPEDPRVSGPGGHTTAAQVEAPLSQTDKTIKSKMRKKHELFSEKAKTGKKKIKKSSLDYIWIGPK